MTDKFYEIGLSMCFLCTKMGWYIDVKYGKIGACGRIKRVCYGSKAVTKNLRFEYLLSRLNSDRFDTFNTVTSSGG